MSAKHIDLQKHFAHETIQNSMMRMMKIDTSKQLADVFTKPLVPYAQFIGCIHGIRSRNSRESRRSDSPRGGPCSLELMIESRWPFGGVFTRKSMEGQSRNHFVSEHPGQCHCRHAESAGTRCVNMTWEAKARARHQLESSLSGSRDSDGDGVSPVVDGSGPM